MDRFLITKTRFGYTVRWAHTNRAIKTFLGSDAWTRAKSFTRWLNKWLSTQPGLSSYLEKRI